MRAGIYPDMQGFAAIWARERQFTPNLPKAEADARYDKWKRAVQATIAV